LERIDVRLFAINFGAPGRAAGGIGKLMSLMSPPEINTVLDNFDITAAAGGALTAVVVPIEGINHRLLNIRFSSRVNFGAIFWY